MSMRHENPHNAPVRVRPRRRTGRLRAAPGARASAALTHAADGRHPQDRRRSPEQQRRLARQRLSGTEGEGQGRRRLRDRVLPALGRPEVHVPVHSSPSRRRGRATCASTRTCGSTTRASASGSGAPSASASAAPTRGARTSTSRASPRNTIRPMRARRSWARTRAQKLLLKGKPGLDLAFPMIRIWIDKDTKNVLKRQEYALSGRLLRTSYYPKWKKRLQRLEERRRLVPGGDPLLRRGREGEPDADPDQGGRPAARCPRTCSRRPGSRARAADVRQELAASRRCCSRGPVRRGRRRAVPATQDIFGGAQPAPAQPAPAQPAPAQPAPAQPPPVAPPATATPGANTPASEPPPAAAAASEALGTERDQSVLGNTGGEVQHLSDYQAPENPLQIGGQIYLRTQGTALQGDAPDRWSLNAPSLARRVLRRPPEPARARLHPRPHELQPDRGAVGRTRDDRQRTPGREPGRVRGRHRPPASRPSPRHAGPLRSSIRCGFASTSHSACS